MTDYKQLCAELVALCRNPELQTSADLWDQVELLANRARAALAEPEPEGPTVMEIIGLADEVEAAGLGQVDLVRAALARWSRPS